MNAKLVSDNGIIKISVNGETLDAVGYMTYNPDGGQFPKFTAIGNKIVFFEGCEGDTGRFVSVRIDRAEAFALYGEKV